ncbi:hypothetical protein MBBA_2550 [Methanoculleus bourgensis]|jgi:hypothetical protein|nr:hypothetical protein MBBA_2550 [Methanoculleus bourgensis]
MRIASRSREAMVPMNTTYAPGDPGQWTVVGIVLGGRGQGRGLASSPHKPDPGARCTRAGGLPLARSGRFHGKC